MSGAQRSQTDLEVLRSSHRGKFISLGLVLVIGGGVWWWSHRDKPIGQREQADRVLVVTQTAWRYKPYLAGWGFTAQEGRAQTMEEEAKEKMPELAVSGAPAILKLADWAGYGYVVFESPKNVDFTGLEVEGGLPTFEPWHRFAVVSAGDYAFPHKMTVNAKPSEVLRGPDLDLLSALFQQEPLLAGTLRDDPKSPAEVMILKTTLSEALARLDDVKDAEKLVARIGEKARALLVDKEKGEPKPALLGGIHESLNAIALADGSTLVLSRKIHFSSGGYNADLDLDKNWEFSYLPAGAEPGSERTPCPSLLGGTLEETGRRPSFRFSPGGDVVLVHVDGASQLWKLEVGAGKECSFVHLGDITVPLVRGEDPGEPHASGKVARVRIDGPDGVLSVVKPKEELALELARSPSIRFHMPAWLDAEWIAAPGYARFDEGSEEESAPTPMGLFLASPGHPDVLLRLDSTALDAAMEIHQVAPAPGGPGGPRLLVTASSEAHGQRLFVVDAPKPWAELYALAEAAAGKKPQAVTDGTEPWVLSLDAAGLTATALTHEGWVSDMVAARDGSAVVFQVSNIDNGIADADSRKEIGLAGLATPGPLRLLTRNGLEDHTPMFTADSKTVVFRTRFPFEKTDWTLTTARSLPASK